MHFRAQVDLDVRLLSGGAPLVGRVAVEIIERVFRHRPDGVGVSGVEVDDFLIGDRLGQLMQERSGGIDGGGGRPPGGGGGTEQFALRSALRVSRGRRRRGGARDAEGDDLRELIQKAVASECGGRVTSSGGLGLGVGFQ